MKCVIADGVQPVRQRDFRQLPTALKGVIRDDRDCIRKKNLLQGGTALKRPFSNGVNATGDGNGTVPCLALFQNSVFYDQAVIVIQF